MEREALFIFLLRYNLRVVKFQVYFFNGNGLLSI